MSERASLLQAPAARAGPSAPRILRRACACGTHTPGGGVCPSCAGKEGDVQRKSIGSGRAIEQKGGDGDVPASVTDVLRGSGSPLEPALRADMASRFQRDFSDVRVHRSSAAEQSARDIDARAFTVGKDIVFAAGQYAPATNAGRSLIAHELAHVVQQSPQTAAAPGALRLGAQDSNHERKADQMSHSAARYEPLPPHDHGGPTVMRAVRTFSLTFDDGPHVAPLNKGINLTEKVLNVLQDKGIKAGFFIQTAALGKKKDGTPGGENRGGHPIGKILVKRMADEGHKIGIHTGGKLDHEDHPVAQKAGRLEGELKSAKAYVKDITGAEPEYVRPPHGHGEKDKDVLDTYAKVSLTNLMWDMDVDKGAKIPLEDLKNNVKTEMLTVKNLGWKSKTASPNIVVLFHDIQNTTANNIGTLIEHIKTTTEKISDKADNAVFKAP